MKYLIHFTRILVGVLFIFSGLVKANDPLGLSYKMQEFFEIWGMHSLNGIALPMAVLLNAFEIIAGTALLVRWKFRTTGWLLLLLILFFTVLTGYTYFTGMPKNCGCFGDCLPISSKVSFLKDLFLTVLILFLYWKRDFIINPSPSVLPLNLMWLSFVISLGLQGYSLHFLPPVDCLPYKKGSSITQNRLTPKDAIPDSVEIIFTYRKNGQEVQFSANNFPADFSATDYQFVKREDQLIREGWHKDPPIKGFVLNTLQGDDSTEQVLNKPLAILIFNEKGQALAQDQSIIQRLRALTLSKGIPVYILTAEPALVDQWLPTVGIKGMTVLSCDLKAIQTAARVNPCYYVLEKGVVKEKVSSRQIEKVWAIIESTNP